MGLHRIEELRRKFSHVNWIITGMLLYLTEEALHAIHILPVLPPLGDEDFVVFLGITCKSWSSLWSYKCAKNVAFLFCFLLLCLSAMFNFLISIVLYITNVTISIFRLSWRNLIIRMDQTSRMLGALLRRLQNYFKQQMHSECQQSM